MLPAMTLAEALKTSHIHRVAGLTGVHTAPVSSILLPSRSPFRRHGPG
jgi:hypothetical protein